MLFAISGCADNDEIHLHQQDKVNNALRQLTENGSLRIDSWIFVDVENQELLRVQVDEIVERYSISTSYFGVSEGAYLESYQTPLGLHEVVEMKGNKAESGTVFSNREATGRIAIPGSGGPNDSIITRLIVLDGCEWGRNKGYGLAGTLVDSRRRGIYIHGTPEESAIGRPASHGCIRMKSDDIVALFDQMGIGDNVVIQ